MTSDDTLFAALREMMVDQIALHAAAASDTIGKARLGERIMTVMSQVPRHEFVPEELKRLAYHDTPLPIGHDKTISQPFMVAAMTDLLNVQPDDRVLEVGTGLGYQAAVLAELCEAVFSVEIISELAADAELRLRRVGYNAIELRVGDGSYGWSDNAPFDKIMVTAAPEMMPNSLLDQLRPGGAMVLPMGPEAAQELHHVRKAVDSEISTASVMPVRFSALITSH